MDAFIEHIKRYIDFNDEDAAVLVPKLNKRSYLKGQYILQAGDTASSQSYIVSGLVRVFYLDDNGNEHNVRFCIEDWWAGDLGSYVSQTPADFHVQCLENTTVVQLKYKDLEGLYQELPKLERFFRLIMQNAYVTGQKRLVRNYTLSAKDRYIQFCEKYPQIVQRVPQYMIASYLGITKEFLSTIRSQLNK